MISIVLISFGIGVVLMAGYIFYLNRDAKKSSNLSTNNEVKEVEVEQTAPKKPSFGSTLQKGKRFKKVKTIEKGEKKKPKEESKPEEENKDA